MLDSISTETSEMTGSAEIHFFRAAAGHRRTDKRTQHLQLNTGTKESQTFTTCNENGNRRNYKQNTGLQTSRKKSTGKTSKKMERSVHVRIESEQTNKPKPSVYLFVVYLTTFPVAQHT
jgi:hypothetical protein